MRRPSSFGKARITVWPSGPFAKIWTVARLNRESLAVWREMLSFAASGDIHDIERVNEHAAAWARRVNALDMTVEEELAILLQENPQSKAVLADKKANEDTDN